MTTKKEEILQRIKEGKTAAEIMEELGMNRNDYIYEIAQKNNIKVTKPSEKKATEARQLIDKGNTITEIAAALNMSWGGTYDLLKRNEIKIDKESETASCPECGASFKTWPGSSRKYCSSKCEKKANRKPKENVDDAPAVAMLAKHNSEWKYIGEYTGSGGSMKVMHKCGHVSVKSCVTVRHGKIRCDVCDERDRKARAIEKKRQKEIEKEVRRFNKPVKKQKQTAAKECPVCGCFFYGNNKYCSPECAKEPIKHYYNTKKRNRIKQSRTPESKTISLRRLYERDHGVCWICGNLCNFEADTNANDYPSIDHIIPIAHGGMDEWKNIKLAHRYCNTMRWVKETE